jgi:hypothetical protein
MADDDVERQVEKPRPAERSVHAVFYIAYAWRSMLHLLGLRWADIFFGTMQELDLLFQLDHSLQQMDNR